MKKSIDFAKKRIMFIQREDYNFLTYNLLLLLDTLECYSEGSRFKDYKKIAYLIDFVATDADIDSYNLISLSSIYFNSHIKKTLLSHILIILKNKGYLNISLNPNHKTYDIWLIKENIPIVFFDTSFFEKEISNIKKLKKNIHILKSTLLKTLVDRLFTKHGVLTWEI